jgi:hypothetical protein
MLRGVSNGSVGRVAAAYCGLRGRLRVSRTWPCSPPWCTHASRGRAADSWWVAIRKADPTFIVVTSSSPNHHAYKKNDNNNTIDLHHTLQGPSLRYGWLQETWPYCQRADTKSPCRQKLAIPISFRSRTTSTSGCERRLYSIFKYPQNGFNGIPSSTPFWAHHQHTRCAPDTCTSWSANALDACNHHLLAVSTSKVHAQRHSIVDKLRPLHVLWRHASFHPVHHGLQHVLVPLERYASGCSIAPLAQNPCSRTCAAMIHA